MWILVFLDPKIGEAYWYFKNLKLRAETIQNFLPSSTFYSAKKYDAKFYLDNDEMFITKECH